jgi:hypothetical protein
MAWVSYKGKWEAVLVVDNSEIMKGLCPRDSDGYTTLIVVIYGKKGRRGGMR